MDDGPAGGAASALSASPRDLRGSSSDTATRPTRKGCTSRPPLPARPRTWSRSCASWCAATPWTACISTSSATRRPNTTGRARALEGFREEPRRGRPARRPGRDAAAWDEYRRTVLTTLAARLAAAARAARPGVVVSAAVVPDEATGHLATGSRTGRNGGRAAWWTRSARWPTRRTAEIFRAPGRAGARRGWARPLRCGRESAPSGCPGQRRREDARRARSGGGRRRALLARVLRPARTWSGCARTRSRPWPPPAPGRSGDRGRRRGPLKRTGAVTRLARGRCSRTVSSAAAPPRGSRRRRPRGRRCPRPARWPLATGGRTACWRA